MPEYVHIIASIHIRMEHARLQQRAHDPGIGEYVQHNVAMLQISGFYRIVVHVLVSVCEQSKKKKTLQSPHGVYVMRIVNNFQIADAVVGCTLQRLIMRFALSESSASAQNTQNAQLVGRKGNVKSSLGINY